MTDINKIKDGCANNSGKFCKEVSIMLLLISSGYIKRNKKDRDLFNYLSLNLSVKFEILFLNFKSFQKKTTYYENLSSDY